MASLLGEVHGEEHFEKLELDGLRADQRLQVGIHSPTE